MREKKRVVPRGEQRRERHRNRADLDRAEENGDELGRVRQEERDPLLRLNPKRAQRVAGAVDGTRDVRVGKRAAGVAESGTVAMTGREVRIDQRAGEVEGLGCR
jgi:hypothetical protein